LSGNRNRRRNAIAVTLSATLHILLLSFVVNETVTPYALPELSQPPPELQIFPQEQIPPPPPPPVVIPPKIKQALEKQTPPPPPPLPPKPAGGRRRRDWLAVGILLIALLVYSWIDTGASVSQFFSGVFGHKGLLRSVLPESVPPQASQFGAAFQAAATTFAIAILSIAFGIVGSLVVLPLAARNITPSRPLYASPKGWSM